MAGQPARSTKIGGQILCLDFLRAPEFGYVYAPHEASLRSVKAFDTSELTLAKAAQHLRTTHIEMRRACGSSQSFAVTKDGLAVVSVLGFIGPGRMAASCRLDDLLATLRDVHFSDEVRAVLLNVDSPGGVFEGVETIYNVIRDIDEEKPVFSFVDRYALGSAFLIAGAARCIAANFGAMVGAVRPTVLDFIDGTSDVGVIPATATFIPDSLNRLPDARVPECFRASYAEVWRAANLVTSRLGVRRDFNASHERPLLTEALDAEAALNLGVVHAVCEMSAAGRAVLRCVDDSTSIGGIQLTADRAKLISADQQRIARSLVAQEEPEAALAAIAAGMSFEAFLRSLAVRAPDDGAAQILPFKSRRQASSPDQSGGPEAA